MSAFSKPLFESRFSLLCRYLIEQIRQKKFLHALRLNSGRLSYWLFNYKKMSELGDLLSKFPVSDLHLFKLKFGALSNYLSRSFTSGSALSVLIENYTYVRAKFTSPSINQIFCGGLECWRFEHNSIRLIKTEDYDYEGSFSFIFNEGEKRMYIMSFSFVRFPANSEDWAIYIARKQGQRGMLAEFKKTTRAFNDNKIVTMVLAAAEGLALALGINSIVGVGTRNQLSYKKPEMLDTFSRSYDDYWETQESVKLESGDYLLPVPMRLKPIEKIPSHHKSRTLLKRKRRLEISNAVKIFIESLGTPESGKLIPYSGSENLLRSEITLTDKESASDLRIINA